MAWKVCQWLHLYYFSCAYSMERYTQHVLKWNDYSMCGSNAVIPCFVLPAIRFYNKENEFSALATRTIPKTINLTKNIISSGIPLVPESYKRDILCMQKIHAINWSPHISWHSFTRTLDQYRFRLMRLSTILALAFKLRVTPRAGKINFPFAFWHAQRCFTFWTQK